MSDESASRVSPIPTPPQPVSEVTSPRTEGCNVYIANLPPGVDATALRRHFSCYGEISGVKLLLDIATGVSRGIGFIMYENPTSAMAAVTAKNRTFLDGNMIQVKIAEKSLVGVHINPPSPIVYVRNVPAAVTVAEAKAYFSQYGTIVEVAPHPQSKIAGGPSPYNFYFITFTTVDSAQKAIEGIDGKSPFPIPMGHPFVMAKMISDVAGEMRKSILHRRRSSDGTAGANSPVAPSPAKTPQVFQDYTQVLHQQQSKDSGMPFMFHGAFPLSPPAPPSLGAVLAMKNMVLQNQQSSTPVNNEALLRRRVSDEISLEGFTFPNSASRRSSVASLPDASVGPPAGYSGERRRSSPSIQSTPQPRLERRMSSPLTGSTMMDPSFLFAQPQIVLLPNVLGAPQQVLMMQGTNGSNQQVVFLPQPFTGGPLFS